MPYTQVNNLDFADIKTAIKEYMRAESDFTDYDFEGSVISQLIDVLAYNTYYTAFNANMVVNELFLDSSTLRDNVVALAKQIGYAPKSITAPKAAINLQLLFTGTAPSAIILKAGTGFITNYDNTLYEFVVAEDYRKEVVNGTATFTDLPVYEGSLILDNTIVDTSLKNQRFIINNRGADVSTLKIKVFEANNSTVSNTYEKADNILSVGSTDRVFFLSEVEDEKYEIFFGDGVLGEKLSNNNVVEISYVTTSGASTNGAKTFTFNGTITDGDGNPVTVPFSVNTLTTSSVASGGAEIESVSDIKFNAPKYFGSQNRAVTSNDYSAIVRKIYPAISDIIVFGGEEQEPPAYGKVFLSIKPTEAASLSSFTKNQLTTELKKYTVASIRPEFIDPSILYVELDSGIYFDGTKTKLLTTDIASKVSKGVQDYLKTSGTEKFNGKFRYSKFVSVIDGADRAISSNDTSITMRKDFIGQINSSSYYEICYKNAFLKDCDSPVVSSTGMTVFEHPNYTVYLEDRNGKLVLYRLDSITGDKILLNDSVGDVDYDKGEIKIYDFTILKGSFSDNRIELRVKPANKDIEVKREMYLDVDVSNSKFIAYKE
tara:strand:- start:23797 stop:25599 length:1803 start_codon:yes stop_codon:yes gene_type:complete